MCSLLIQNITLQNITLVYHPLLHVIKSAFWMSPPTSDNDVCLLHSQTAIYYLREDCFCVTPFSFRHSKFQ